MNIFIKINTISNVIPKLKNQNASSIMNFINLNVNTYLLVVVLVLTVHQNRYIVQIMRVPMLQSVFNIKQKIPIKDASMTQPTLQIHAMKNIRLAKTILTIK